ncbi:carbohydrate sulfotransferase 10-like [Belonocnema kinseyi]|uniref:carbohydrate sulfotransferase 10-like n=1 Tax=Belonocnema kinseyi TaxID=2817044 RepID=UPI00143DEAFC|nr:carbohydrate sulfotransferase 10-like [Belonocnema kinseyi]
MQAKKRLQVVFFLSATFTCFTFLNKPVYISYKIESDDIQIPNLNTVTVSKSYILDILSSKTRKRLRDEIQERVNKLEELCDIHGNPKRLETVISKMIINVEHGISWCPIYKSASSTWMKHFASLKGILTKETKELVEQNLVQISTLVHKAYENELNTNATIEKLSITKKFLVVRHPFERLLSAYRDKLEHMEGREYYYRRFGRHITYKYRQNKKENDTRLEPLFVEFLEFIAKEKYFDEHWVPYYETCMPCDIKYDYILKLESLNEEISFLLLETGLQDHIDFRVEFNNITSREATTKSVTKKYYKDVPLSLLKKIYSVYETDFKLFSYSSEEYYLLGKNE